MIFLQRELQLYFLITQQEILMHLPSPNVREHRNNYCLTNLKETEQLGKYKIGDTVNINIIRDKRFMQIDNITLKIFPVPIKLLYGERAQKIPIPNKKKN